ncbi:MAG TPA: L-aspartate oxidase [Longimicrobiales bacterium]|nr:L-aspartate oxidase [Longimicrobiales bacterium]
MERTTDVLVVGSGIAGLTFALKLAPKAHVLLVTKKERAASSTNYARGGIASVMGSDDNFELHAQDTLVAGAGLCHPRAVEALVREGPARVRELIEWGARFDQGEGGSLSLGREGGHSRRRIAHAGDHTGKEIENALLAAVEAEPNIEVLEDHLALDLLVAADAAGHPACTGALVLEHPGGNVMAVRARFTMLAAGGCGQVYRNTTNPSIATGDGIAMAYRAGARVGNMEFIQFHPTALHPTEDPAFLISEAVRGEGAILRTLDGGTFMERYHPLESLAPRDVVARAIDRELKERGETHVLLDVSSIPAVRLAERFPDAVSGCRERGVDPARGIPVVPAAHYACGGVLTDSAGHTSLAGLYATGEVACSGVHGANRLASNSLLEAVVFADRAARTVSHRLATFDGRVVTRASGSDLPSPGDLQPDLDGIAQRRRELRDLMWDLVGIVRSDDRLEVAEARIASLSSSEAHRWIQSRWTAEGAELRNLLQVAELIVRCGRMRRESRGLHYTMDHPYRDNEHSLRDTVVSRSGGFPW